MKIIVLGSGTSHGIPVVGCDCPVCSSTDPRDKRMRSSLYVEGPEGERLVIDTGPEFRLQALAAGIKKLDAVFLTHSHADHLHGLDDVRPLSRDNPLPVYGNAQAISEMKERFSYAFRETQRGGGKPRLIPSIVKGPVKLGNLTITPVPVKHGNLDILGWHISETSRPKGGLLYLTDTSSIEPETARCLHADLLNDLLIIGGLKASRHQTHFNFDQALNTALELGSPRVFLTHICHEHFHREIEEYCRNFKKNHDAEKVEMGPAWDSMEIILSA